MTPYYAAEFFTHPGEDPHVCLHRNRLEVDNLDQLEAMIKGEGPNYMWVTCFPTGLIHTRWDCGCVWSCRHHPSGYVSPQVSQYCLTHDRYPPPRTRMCER